VSFLRELVRSRVRFLCTARVLVSLGGRSTCVDASFQVSRRDLGDLVVGGSFFPLGQEEKG
jgi:hypothetical protein